ncbi:hypothetical protein RRG08_048063 [Elysia crispata]|uniref:Uncharacterized protein n=1 Tax=Elysia crispata TaxID=231223 RepID=A0AAE1D8R7_9GAST|nr:hypothetical protein RRG08_048063 [Elysia crispata]
MWMWLMLEKLCKQWEDHVLYTRERRIWVESRFCSNTVESGTHLDGTRSAGLLVPQLAARIWSAMSDTMRKALQTIGKTVVRLLTTCVVPDNLQTITAHDIEQNRSARICNSVSEERLALMC